MSIEETIKQAIAEAVEPLQKQIDQLLSVVVVQQKDACTIAGVSDEIIRNRARKGEVSLLQKNGSRLNYLTLKDVSGLKPRRKPTKVTK